MSDLGLSKELGITLKAAKQLKKIFKSAMPDAIRWMEYIEKFGEKNLYVESPLGRRRRVWGYLINKKHAEMKRICVNSVIQGLCSDLAIIVASLIIKDLYNKGIAKYQVIDKDTWLITNIVHDDIEPEIPIKDVYKFLTTYEIFFTDKLIKYVKKVYNFDIKIRPVVDFDLGLSLKRMKKWDGTKNNAKQIQNWLVKEDKKRK